MAAVEAGGAGRVVGTVFEGQRRFGLAVRLKQDGKLDPGVSLRYRSPLKTACSFLGSGRQRES